MTVGPFPVTRLRRNRADGWSRRLVAETRLSVDDLIWPVFVRAGTGQMEGVASMPGAERVTLDRLAAHVGPAVELGIPVVALFAATPADSKDAEGTEAINPDNLICRAARELKRAAVWIGLATTVLAVWFLAQPLLLIIGGIVLWVIEGRPVSATTRGLTQVSRRQALVVGCAQCLALVPGVSRSASMWSNVWST